MNRRYRVIEHHRDERESDFNPRVYLPGYAEGAELPGYVVLQARDGIGCVEIDFGKDLGTEDFIAILRDDEIEIRRPFADGVDGKNVRRREQEFSGAVLAERGRAQFVIEQAVSIEQRYLVCRSGKRLAFGILEPGNNFEKIGRHDVSTAPVFCMSRILIIARGSVGLIGHSGIQSKFAARADPLFQTSVPGLVPTNIELESGC